MHKIEILKAQLLNFENLLKNINITDQKKIQQQSTINDIIQKLDYLYTKSALVLTVQKEIK